MGGLVISGINHASEAKAMSAENERSLRASTVTAIWQKVGRHRNPGVIFTLLTKGHNTDVSKAMPTSRVLKYARAVRADPELGHRSWGIRPKAMIRRTNCDTGPVDLLLHACARLNIRWDGPARFTVLGKVFGVNEVENLHKFAHYLREAARKVVWTQTRQDQARGENPEQAALGELGLGEGVDRDRTMLYYNDKDTTEDVKGILRLIFVNGVWTNKIRAKMPNNREEGSTPICPYCDSGEEESLEHLWWECPAWAYVRKLHYGSDGIMSDTLNIDAWPPCTKNCAIVNKGFNTIVDMNIVQRMYVDIFKARCKAEETLVRPDE